MKKRLGEFTLLSGVIFFFDIFIALLIIIGASLLSQTSFGKSALVFGFIMIAITTVLKLARKW